MISVSKENHHKIRSNVYLDTDLKAAAQELFKKYGLSFSEGLNLLLQQATQKGSPILIQDLEIEALSKDSKEHKIMQERKKEKSYSLDSIMKEFGI